jgi:purine-cytosine permease-like protein
MSDTPAESAGREEPGYIPSGLRRSTFTPAPDGAEAPGFFDDDALAAAMEAEVRPYTASIPLPGLVADVVEPVAVPEPAAAPEAVVLERVAAPEPVIAPEPVVAPEPVAPAEPEPVLSWSPFTPSAPEWAAVPEPVAEPEPVVAPEPVAAPESVAAPEPFDAPEPVAAPEPVVAPEPEIAPVDDEQLLRDIEGVSTADAMQRLEQELARRAVATGPVPIAPEAPSFFAEQQPPASWPAPGPDPEPVAVERAFEPEPEPAAVVEPEPAPPADPWDAAPPPGYVPPELVEPPLPVAPEPLARLLPPPTDLPDIARRAELPPPPGYAEDGTAAPVVDAPDFFPVAEPEPVAVEPVAVETEPEPEPTVTEPPAAEPASGLVPPAAGGWDQLFTPPSIDAIETEAAAPAVIPMPIPIADPLPAEPLVPVDSPTVFDVPTVFEAPVDVEAPPSGAPVSVEPPAPFEFPVAAPEPVEPEPLPTPEPAPQPSGPSLAFDWSTVPDLDAENDDVVDEGDRVAPGTSGLAFLPPASSEPEPVVAPEPVAPEFVAPEFVAPEPEPEPIAPAPAPIDPFAVAPIDPFAAPAPVAPEPATPAPILSALAPPASAVPEAAPTPEPDPAPEPRAPRAREVEAAGAEPTPLDRRAGRVARLFWLWFAANASVVSVALGAVMLGMGMSLRQAIVATVVGIALSFIPLGFGTLAGKWSGQPTMIVSRASFGTAGNILPALLALVVRVFWGAVLVWLLADAVGGVLVQAHADAGLGASGWAFIGVAAGVIVAGAVAVLGYGLLARVQLVLSIVAGLVIVAAAVVTLPSVQLGAALTHQDGPWTVVAGGAVLVFSFVGLVWAQSGSDLARYQRPTGSGAGSMLWATFGACIPPFVLIAWGAVLAASSPKLAAGLATQPLATIAGLLPSWYPAPLLAAAAVGLLSGSVLTMYSGGFALQSLLPRLTRSGAVLVTALLVLLAGLALVLLGVGTGAIIRDLAVTLAVPVAAWTGIFAAEMMIRQRRFHAPSLLAAGGVYPVVRWVNLVGLVVISALGYGFVIGGQHWLGWEGWALRLLGIDPASPIATADLGVLGALLVGILLPLATAVPTIRRQEAANAAPEVAAALPART